MLIRMPKLYLKTYLNRLVIILSLSLSFIQGQDDGSVYGFVTDSSSGEALIGANVFINDFNIGMATDVNGYYVLQEIKPGNYEITVSYVGYELLKQNVTIVGGIAQKLDLVLREEVVVLTSVEVTAEKIKRKNNIQLVNVIGRKN